MKLLKVSLIITKNIRNLITKVELKTLEKMKKKEIW